MQINELRQVIELMTQYGVTRLSLDQLHIELELKKPSTEIHIAEQPQSPMPKRVELSNEDMLFYSVEEPKQE